MCHIMVKHMKARALQDIAVQEEIGIQIASGPIFRGKLIMQADSPRLPSLHNTFPSSVYAKSLSLFLPTSHTRLHPFVLPATSP